MSKTPETPVPAETIEVQNVVGSGDLGRELDLAAVAMDLDGAEYNPKKMPGLLYRPPRAEASVLLFESGKLIVMGATTSDGTRRTFRGCVGALRDLGVSVADPTEIAIENIVARVDFGDRLNLNAVAIGLGLEWVEYEPEQFPGLVYRLDAPEAVVLLFTSGKAVVTGTIDRATIETVVETVATRLTGLGLLDAD